MRTEFRSKSRSIEIYVTKAVDELAEEKDHIATFNWFEYDKNVFKARVRILLCQKYGFSAERANELVKKNLTCVNARKIL